ncbi:MAG: hypothetical protein R6X27_09195 [Candidatus Desulfacyla sp.]
MKENLGIRHDAPFWDSARKKRPLRGGRDTEPVGCVKVSGPPWRYVLDLDLVIRFLRFTMICDNYHGDPGLGQGFRCQNLRSAARLRPELKSHCQREDLWTVIHA